MASQIGSAITPAGHQAYSDLVNTEMQNKAMAQQAFQNQQQMQMQRDQFGASLEESDRARRFNAAQMEAYQKWQDATVAKEQRYQMQLELIQARAREARDQGKFDLVAQLQDEDMQLRRARAENGMRLAIAGQSIGKTKKEIEGLISTLKNQVDRQTGIEEQNISLAESHKDGLASMFREKDRQSAISQARMLQMAQTGGADTSGLGALTYYLGPGVEDVAGLATAGELTGIEWLDFNSSMGLSGMLPGTTRQGSLVSGSRSSAEIADAIKGRIVDSVIEYLPRMGFKNLNEGAARELLTKAAGGGASQAELAQLASKANIPPSALKTLLGSVANSYNMTDSNAAWKSLMDADMRYRQSAGYQPDDLKTLAIAKQKDAFATYNRILHDMASRFEITGVNDYKAVSEMLARAVQTGQLDSLASSEVKRLMPGYNLDRLMQLQQGLPAAVSEAELMGQMRGDLADQEAGQQSLIPARVAASGARASSEERRALEELLSQMGGQ